MHGNEERLAKEVEKGANSVEGVEGKLWQACMCVSFKIISVLLIQSFSFFHSIKLKHCF